MEFNITEESPWRKYFVTLVIILVSTLSFGIGRLTAPDNRGEIEIESDEEISNYSNSSNYSKDTVYASKNGKKYYYSGCSGLSRISEANKISFASAIAAEASGYSLASNCQPR